MIAEFDSDGLLPPGIHFAEWREFELRFGVNTTRKSLLKGLKRALTALQFANCSVVCIDGSFVTSKPIPDDYDLCWSVIGVDPSRLDPVMLDFRDSRSAQKAKYLGELFPAELNEGITGKTWLEFFQQSRDGVPKGIVAIDLRSFE